MRAVVKGKRTTDINRINFVCRCRRQVCSHQRDRQDRTALIEVKVVDIAIRAYPGEKPGVGCAIRIQPGDAHGGLAVQDIEVAADNYSTTDLRQEGPHPGVGTRAGIKIEIKSSIGLQSSDMVLAQNSTGSSEVTAHRDFTRAHALDSGVISPGRAWRRSRRIHHKRKRLSESGAIRYENA